MFTKEGSGGEPISKEVKSREKKEQKEGKSKWDRTLERVCDLSEKFKEEAADIVQEFWDEWKDKGVSFEEAIDLVISAGEMFYQFASDSKHANSRYNISRWESILRKQGEHVKRNGEDWDTYKTMLVLNQAIEKYFTEPKSIEDIDSEQTKTFLKLMKISSAVDQVMSVGEFDADWEKERFTWEERKSTGFYNQNTGAADLVRFKNRLTFKHLEDSEKKTPVLFISYEDRKDYDSSFIKTAKNKDRLYKEVLGFDTFIKGDKHFVSLLKIMESLKDYIGEEGLRQIETKIEKYKKRQKEEKIKEEKKRQEEWEEKIEKQLNEQEFAISKEEVELVKKVLGTHSFEIRDRNIEREKDFLIISNKGSKSVATGMEVKDYETLQVVAIDLKQAQLFQSPKREVLWRSTEKGMTGKGISEKIKGVKFDQKRKTVSIEFEDGKGEEIDLSQGGKKVESLKEMSEEVKEAIDKKIKALIEDIKEHHKHLEIPLYVGKEMTRPANVMVSNIEYIDSRTAKVTISEEIDYQPGIETTGRGNPPQYFIQSRITTYQVTPQEATKIESETTDFR